MQRVLDGAIGQIRAIQETYLTGPLWNRARQPDDTEMRYQVRNWYYFTWLSGDFNTEQHVHSLDKALWAMHDEPPVRAWGLGGRQVRTDAIFGDIYDHHAVVYEWPNGVRVFSYCRQQAGCYSDVSDHFLGSLGEADILKHKITGKNPWHFSGDGGNMYDLEHQALFAAIRSGQAINNGLYMARSTMLAILGRMVDYTGRDAHLGRGAGLPAAFGPHGLHLGRRAAHQARPRRQVSRGHARVRRSSSEKASRRRSAILWCRRPACRDGCTTIARVPPALPVLGRVPLALPVLAL